MLTPDQLTARMFESARKAVAGHTGAIPVDEVERIVRAHALAWYNEGMRDTLAAARMSALTRDAGALQ